MFSQTARKVGDSEVVILKIKFMANAKKLKISCAV